MTKRAKVKKNVIAWNPAITEIWEKRQRWCGKIFANAAVPVSLKVIREGFTAVEGKGAVVRHVFMHPKTYLKFVQQLTDVTDPQEALASLELEKHEYFVSQGQMGYLWGAVIIMGRRVPQNRIWFVGGFKPHITCAVIELIDPDPATARRIDSKVTTRRIDPADVAKALGGEPLPKGVRPVSIDVARRIP